MCTVRQFGGQAEARPGVTHQMWVTAYIEKVAGLGKESFTYVGCSKQIAPPGSLPWFCRRRVGKGPFMADEHVNHCHEHTGDCSSEENGIHCFALRVTIADCTGDLTAEVWAPAMHLLGMKPTTWMGLSKDIQNQHLHRLKERPFEMLLMSVHEYGVFSHYKVYFVKPTTYNPKLTGLGALATKLESLAVVEDEDEHSICTAGVAFAPPACTASIWDKLKEAVKMISDSYSLNAQAVSILHDIMGELPSSSNARREIRSLLFCSLLRGSQRGQINS